MTFPRTVGKLDHLGNLGIKKYLLGKLGPGGIRSIIPLGAGAAADHRVTGMPGCRSRTPARPQLGLAHQRSRSSNERADDYEAHDPHRHHCRTLIPCADGGDLAKPARAPPARPDTNGWLSRDPRLRWSRRSQNAICMTFKASLV
jgi:hypothetical protein